MARTRKIKADPQATPEDTKTAEVVITPAPVEQKPDPTLEHVEGEIVDAPKELAVPQPASDVLIPLGSLLFQDPKAVISAVHEVAVQLVKIVDDLKLFKIIKNKKFVYVDGWETLGGMLGVSAHEESSKRWEDGTWEAVVVLKRNKDGAVVGRASAICGMDEEWATRDEYARKSMATTRATGKAFRLTYSWIMKLAGYEGTPAEEMNDEEQDKEAAKEDKATPPPANPNKRPFDRPIRPKPADDAKKIFADYAVHLGINKADIRTEINAMLKANDLSFNLSQWEKLCKGLEDWCAGKDARMAQAEEEKRKAEEAAKVTEPAPTQEPEPVAEDPTDGAPAQEQPSEETK